MKVSFVFTLPGNQLEKIYVILDTAIISLQWMEGSSILKLVFSLCYIWLNHLDLKIRNSASLKIVLKKLSWTLYDLQQ